MRSKGLEIKVTNTILWDNWFMEILMENLDATDLYEYKKEGKEILEETNCPIIEKVTIKVPDDSK